MSGSMVVERGPRIPLPPVAAAVNPVKLPYPHGEPMSGSRVLREGAVLPRVSPIVGDFRSGEVGEGSE